MKIQFDSNLDYQDKAISSVVDIFEGQEICKSNFSIQRVDKYMVQKSINDYNDLGIGNRLELLPDEILSNIQNIQLKNALPQSKKLESMDFSVEMETGTGKTYIYLKSIFEMNRKYGFTKFIIVVPSIAIKEGTKKTLDITTEHFKSTYDNVNYDHFIYDSSNLEQVRDFATSSDIRIMVINIDAFKKSFTDPSKDTKANIIHRQNDRLNGQKPIEFIASTNPIVIIDEPQSVDNTPKSKIAIEKLNPLCKLRYSATHSEKYNLMYKLDSIDAYEQKLVKQIEVASIGTSESYNQAYLRLISVKAKPRSAKIEIDISKNAKTTRKTITIKDGSDLYELSNGRDVYDEYSVIDIYTQKGNEYVEFGNGEVIKLGETKGGIDEDVIKRLQIKKTIEEHLDKELRLKSKGIKVLSLFFIDRVSNYRQYNEDGNPINGKFADWFEEEYLSIVKKPKYKTLVCDMEVSKIHNGYFSSDKGKLKDSTTRGNKNDEDTFGLIMKDKEKLLSFDSSLRFVFSHSALKEGWDNPNVFQICTLNETKSVTKKRQEIGRGLRICVDQEGKRVYGFDVNTLSVMANESYEDFAASLQKEIEDEEGIKFGSLQEHSFANIVIENTGIELEYFGAKSSEDVYGYLVEQNYIDKKGKIQNSLRLDIKDNKFEVPQIYKEVQTQIISIIKKIAGNLNIKNADDKVSVRLNKQILLGDDFKELWEKIKYKTTYRVNFDAQELINTCAKKIQDELHLGKVKYIYSKVKSKIVRSGIEIDSIQEKNIGAESVEYPLPDILTYLQNETNLTRKDIAEILVKSGQLKSFKNNPQKFIDRAVEIIKKTMSIFIVDGIEYKKIGDYYAQELFEEKELTGYLKSNMIENIENKSIYNHTVYDSDIEKAFAMKFNENEDVKLFTKLPNWFKINTPLGNYNPDWAVLIEQDNQERLYFVVESKGSLSADDLRSSEKAKIDCGKEHFKAISTDVSFIQSNNYENFSEHF
ncbi:MAG: Type III restriction enzyme, res subunit:DEAD/DEAH box helicase, N-terminal [uncultured Campylobacterales bacterium]|uniref:Type III restriction enzyme, res subunit:DEAD/DEAH box helicase, N-terminal n=1 Tax=uncultured Campylobacterales bacterium TaxID=352960 RepID=A0A6S6SSA2_9BACT|nr:MAG: Type III restriction enzyme, res subunit:DEAD/DEAH box helicase, N-terminal [uncultured Campylobacterales bacterium]